MVRFDFSPWFVLTALSGVVAVFLIVLLIALAIPPTDLVAVQGTLEQYTTTSQGEVHLRLRGDPRTFEIRHIEYFEQAAFVQEVEVGDPVVPAIRKKDQEDTSLPLVVFELAAGDTTYLPREAVLAHARRDLPTMGAVAGGCLLVCAGTGALGYRHLRRKRARKQT